MTGNFPIVSLDRKMVLICIVFARKIPDWSGEDITIKKAPIFGSFFSFLIVCD